MEYAVSKHALNRFVARAYRANVRSINLIERLGMRYDRPLDSNTLGEILLFSVNCESRKNQQQ